MSFYTTKPVKYLRVPSRLYSLPFADSIVTFVNHLFTPGETANSERDTLALRQMRHKHNNAYPVISLCKHVKGDINLDVSRVYSHELKFLRFNGFSGLSNANLTADTYILFDEDIGGGYGISCIKNYLRDFKHVNAIEETTIRFDPKYEELLDLKDFIYKFDNTSGLVILQEGAEFTERVSYIERQDILEKFASIKPEYTERFAKIFWLISWYYHSQYYNKNHVERCITELLNLGYDVKELIEFQYSYDFTSKLYDVLKSN